MTKEMFVPTGTKAPESMHKAMLERVAARKGYKPKKKKRLPRGG